MGGTGERPPAAPKNSRRGGKGQHLREGPAATAPWKLFLKNEGNWGAPPASHASIFPFSRSFPVDPSIEGSWASPRSRRLDMYNRPGENRPERGTRKWRVLRAVNPAPNQTGALERNNPVEYVISGLSPLFAEQYSAWGFSRSNCVRWVCSSSPGSSFRSFGERRGRPYRRPAGSIGPAVPDEGSPRGSRVLTPQFSPGSSPSCPPGGCCVGSWPPGPWARSTGRGPPPRPAGSMAVPAPVTSRARTGRVDLRDTGARAPLPQSRPRYRRSTELSDSL